MRTPQNLKFIKILSEKISKVNLIVHGQGIFLFETSTPFTCTFTFYDESKSSGLKVQFSLNSVLVNEIPSNKPLIDTYNAKGLTNNHGAYYWFSLDSQNQTLYAGIGEPREETIIYQYAFNTINNDQRVINKTFLESLTHIELENNTITPMKLIRDPITKTTPMLVKSTDELTMDDIAEGKYLPDANLSLTAQTLYRCVSGKKFVLDTKDFPEFSKAIEYSINSPDGWCNKRLQQKATEFNKDKPNILETYLRITLNQNNGESPGIPYVMEIWPVGHYSPVHNHGNANAIIRVLHGSINVSLFPYLSTGVGPFDVVDFVKNDVTWISPTLNQIHQLKNLPSNTSACITIQCYMYDNENSVHYDYFDYIDDDGKTEQYEPDSDMDFVQFKILMKKEWNEKIVAKCFSC
jgi:hypothetical protein